MNLQCKKELEKKYETFKNLTEEQSEENILEALKLETSLMYNDYDFEASKDILMIVAGWQLNKDVFRKYAAKYIQNPIECLKESKKEEKNCECCHKKCECEIRSKNCCNQSKINDRAGILFIGGHGLGKTSSFEVVNSLIKVCGLNASPIQYKCAKQVASAAKKASMSKGEKGCQSELSTQLIGHILIDDIGQDKVSANFEGEKLLDAINSIIERKYNSGQKCLVHATTNLSSGTDFKAFSQMYESKSVDFLKGYFNLILLPKAKSKRTLNFRDIWFGANYQANKDEIYDWLKGSRMLSNKEIPESLFEQSLNDIIKGVTKIFEIDKGLRFWKEYLEIKANIKIAAPDTNFIEVVREIKPLNLSADRMTEERRVYYASYLVSAGIEIHGKTDKELQMLYRNEINRVKKMYPESKKQTVAERKEMLLKQLAELEALE